MFTGRPLAALGIWTFVSVAQIWLFGPTVWATPPLDIRQEDDSRLNGLLQVDGY